MEIEKEKRKMKKDTLTKSSSSSIPLDLSIEIVLRLPGKSIVRFRCVSKLWSSMTTTPHFIKSFNLHSSARPCLLSVKKEEDKCLFFSLPHHHHHDHYTRVEKYEMIFPKEDSSLAPSETFFPIPCFDIHQSIHGLINFGNSESVIIWNPTLRQHVTLPDPPKISKPLISLLGYDPIGNVYKVLCMSLCKNARKNRKHPQVFTMGPHESWRTITGRSSRNPKSNPNPSPIHCTMKSWRCIKGVVYYFAADETIVSFDVRSEKFGVIQIPETINVLLNRSGLINHNGRLGLYFNYGNRSVITLWVLEEHEWSLREESVLPFDMMDLNPWNGFLLASGETGDGEFIYLPTSTRGSFYAIYYDFKRERVRKVTYDGIDNNKFRFYCFPNHVENLMCLKNLLAGVECSKKWYRPRKESGHRLWRLSHER